MKLFKKLMAGAMAIAMLSAYTVAFASSEYSQTSGGKAAVSGAGTYAGASAPVFLMKMPTAAANSLLAFTIDPDESIKNSPPDNAIPAASGGSTYGTVIFSTKSGSGTIYKNESTALKVISKSSVDVTVNMLATVSDTKMTLSTSSGFSGDNAEKHLYLAVKVATMSGGTSTLSGSAGSGVSVISGGSEVKSTENVTALGAKNATKLKVVSENFKTTVSGGTTTTTAKTATASGGAIQDESWNSVEYTVVGAANPNADWQIPGITAPNLTIKWVVDPANEITYSYGTLPTGTNYTAQFDKDEYKAGEKATIFVQPKNEEEKLSSVTLNYIAINTTTGKTTEEKSVSGKVVSTTPVNGVYSAEVTWPSDMARSLSPVGDSAYKEPRWEVEIGS